MSERAASELHVIEPPARHGFVERGMPALVAPASEWAPEVDARLARVGTRIFVVADVFFFAAWFFAFFYLRALNNNNYWLPPGTTHPTRAIGAAIAALAVIAAVLCWAGMRVVVSRPATARLLLWLALSSGVICFVVQIYEFRHLGFDPQLGGGFPSVFVGLKGVWLFQLVGALLWLTTHIAQVRPNGDAQIRPVSAATFSGFMIFLAAIGLVSYLVMYFV